MSLVLYCWSYVVWTSPAGRDIGCAFHHVLTQTLLVETSDVCSNMCFRQTLSVETLGDKFQTNPVSRDDG